MSRHRVLVLIKGLGKGGAEQLLVSALPYLNYEKFSYEVAYLLPHKDALLREIENAGVRVHCLGGIRMGRWIGDLRMLVKERRVDLLHAHLPYTGMGARLAFLRSRHPQVVYTEHGPWRFYRRSTYLGNLGTFGRNDHVFAVSEDVRRSIRYPAAARFIQMPPVETLYQGIDFSRLEQDVPTVTAREELGISSRAPVVGTVANFRTQKRYDVLLKAAKLVLREIPASRFVLVGQGPLEGAMRGLASQLDLGDAVIFTGFRRDAVNLMHAFDVFVLSSDWEGLPIALLEAMYTGKPAVVTATGGVLEAITHNRNGLVVPTDDPRALAREIIRLLSDAALRERVGANARERARAFDIRKTVARSEEVYESLLS